MSGIDNTPKTKCHIATGLSLRTSMHGMNVQQSKQGSLIGLCVSNVLPFLFARVCTSLCFSSQPLVGGRITKQNEFSFVSTFNFQLTKATHRDLVPVWRIRACDPHVYHFLSPEIQQCPLHSTKCLHSTSKLKGRKLSCWWLENFVNIRGAEN